MHDQQTKDRFIELRALDISFDKISAEIGVTKRTLVDWGKEFASEIADLRALHREALKQKLLGDAEQWSGRLVARFNRLDDEFARRKLEYSPTESVFRMLLHTRREITKELLAEPPPTRAKTRNDNPNQNEKP